MNSVAWVVPAGVNMKIEFTSRQVEKLLNNEKELRKTHRNEADAIKQRLAQLAALECLDDIRHLPEAISVHCHQLTGKGAGHFAVNVSARKRLIFVPCFDEYAGNLADWKTIVHIIITGVHNYHD